MFTGRADGAMIPPQQQAVAVIGNPNDQQQRKLRMEKIAKHFEKYLPLDDNEKEALTSRLMGQKHNN